MKRLMFVFAFVSLLAGVNKANALSSPAVPTVPGVVRGVIVIQSSMCATSVSGQMTASTNPFVVTSTAMATILPNSGWNTTDIEFMTNNLQDGTSLYYSIGTSTANIFSAGYVIRLSTLTQGVSDGAGFTPPTFISYEGGEQLNFMLAPGVSSLSAGGVVARWFRKRIGSLY